MFDDPTPHPDQDDLAPDADEKGDDLPGELEEFVMDESAEIVPDNVDKQST